VRGEHAAAAAAIAAAEAEAETARAKAAEAETTAAQLAEDLKAARVGLDILPLFTHVIFCSKNTYLTAVADCQAIVRSSLLTLS
jgi:hypothetical protein